MVWGGISLRHRTPLVRIDGTLTGMTYRDNVLGPFVLPALQVIGPGAIFQDDNARPHRAHVVTAFEQAHNIDHMEWPAQSPDLSPIEHMWDFVGRQVRENYPHAANVNELFNQLQQEWQAVPHQRIQRLRSMRQRCLECIQAHGGHTRY